MTRKPTLSIFHQVINVVVMRKTFQDFVSFWYKLCLFERQLKYLHIDTNHYVVSYKYVAIFFILVKHFTKSTKRRISKRLLQYAIQNS